MWSRERCESWWCGPLVYLFVFVCVSPGVVWRQRGRTSEVVCLVPPLLDVQPSDDDVSSGSLLWPMLCCPVRSD